MGKLSFRLVEEPDVFDEDEFEKDYIAGLTHKQLMEKHRIGKSRLITSIKHLKEKGITCKYNPKNYYYSTDMGKWVVSKKMNNKVVYCDYFDTEEEAIAEVDRMRRINWGVVE